MDPCQSGGSDRIGRRIALEDRTVVGVGVPRRADAGARRVLDTSLSYNFDFIEVFVRRFGAERVLFGTDLYSPPLGRRISHLLPQILESSLPQADKAAVLGGNARRLFAVDR